MVNQLDFIPSELMGGETIAVTVEVDGYTPVDGYALKYQFAASTPVEITGVASGDGWTITVPAATTVQWPSGVVSFVGFVTASGEGGAVTAIDSGFIRVTASPMYVSWAKTAIASIEAVLANTATSEQASFAIGDMSASKWPPKQLMEFRDALILEVQKSGANRIPRRMLARFD